MDWDEPQNAKPKGVVVGETLDALSVEDLEERVDALRAEIVRVEAEVKRRKEHQDQAASVFKS